MIRPMLASLLDQPAIIEEADRLDRAETLDIQTITLSYDKNGVASMAIPKGFGPSFDPATKVWPDLGPIAGQLAALGLDNDFTDNPQGLGTDVKGSLEDNPEESKHGRT